MPLPDGAVQVFSEVTRLSTLDVNGFPVAGSATYVTNQLLKATLTPVMETGVDLVLVNSNGDISAHFKHGDMPKYYTMAIDLATPDPALHAMICGGTVFADSTAALGTPTGSVLVTGQTTLGTLPTGSVGYRVTQYNNYGESTATAEVTANLTGPTATAVVTGWTLASGAVGARLYGRTPGGEQLIGSLVNIGSQATSAVSGTGAVTSLTVTALTKPIPAGYTFQIAGDTNSPKITWTVLTAAGVGATALSVSPSGSVGITIAAGALNPAFFDSGAVVPAGGIPATDTTAGPGSDVGYQAPALGVVGNPNGVGMEFWGKSILNGTQASYLPYGRWVIPGCKNMHEEARTFQAGIMENSYAGQAFENPNWGSGPFGDWPFDSSKVFQYARMGRQTEPVAGLTTVGATF